MKRATEPWLDVEQFVTLLERKAKRPGRPPKSRTLKWIMRRGSVGGRPRAGYHFTDADIRAINEWRADERRKLGRRAYDRALLAEWLSMSGRCQNPADLPRLVRLYASRLSRAEKLFKTRALSQHGRVTTHRLR